MTSIRIDRLRLSPFCLAAILWPLASGCQMLHHTEQSQIERPIVPPATQSIQLAAQSVPVATQQVSADVRLSDPGEVLNASASEFVADQGSEPFVPVSLEEHSPLCCPPRYTLHNDLSGAGGRLWCDAKGVANWENATLLALAAGGAIAIRQDIDGEVRKSTSQHPNRWGDGSEVLGKFGNPEVQIPALLALYAYGLKTQDEELHDLSGSLISAYAISSVSTVLLKVAVNTERPTDTWNNGNYGFPSYHTASSFAMAAVIDEYYGPKAGIGAYAFAGLIGWSRIDERDHDLSDVLFGAALGYVVGKSVAGRHLYGDSRVRLLPYTHITDGSTGVMCEVAF